MLVLDELAVLVAVELGALEAEEVAAPVESVLEPVASVCARSVDEVDAALIQRGPTAECDAAAGVAVDPAAPMMATAATAAPIEPARATCCIRDTEDMSG